jgi:ubiquinone/menaquinone biosynthesis C-methylase UbiE
MNAPASQFGDGDAYERLMGRWSRPVGEVFLDWLGLPKGLRCLDVGCGNGAFTEVLIARGAPAATVGIDPSEEQIAYARTRPGAQQAQFRTGNALNLPFADGEFDAAVMALAITFVPDPQKAVAEMARVVRPGGWVATYMWDIPGGGNPLEPIQKAMRSLGMPYQLPPTASVSRQESMRALWQESGLQTVEERVIRIPVSYSSFDDFWESNAVPVGPIGQTLKEIAPDAIERLKAHLREYLPRDANGRIGYEAFANAVKGRAPA